MESSNLIMKNFQVQILEFHYFSKIKLKASYKIFCRTGFPTQNKILGLKAYYHILIIILYMKILLINNVLSRV